MGLFRLQLLQFGEACILEKEAFQLSLDEDFENESASTLYVVSGGDLLLNFLPQSKLIHHFKRLVDVVLIVIEQALAVR